MGADLTPSDRRSKLSVRGAGKNHGSVVALSNASFELYEGEFLTLLGPSGSGKTTLLMIVAGLTEPSSGEVWIDGRLSTYVAPHKRDIGLVFQNYALFPHLTVRENVAFPLQMRGLAGSEVDSRVTQALETVQLAHTADRLPRNLSGGQQQRIALARCFVYRPSIILMDEPLGALDRKLRDQMQMEIKALHRTLGITVLYVTHDQDEAMTMSDRICLMNEGVIEQIDSPKDLYFRPRTIFAADFVGDSNLIEVTVSRQLGPTRYAVAGPGGQLEVHSETSFSVGQRGKVMVRPESVRRLGQAEDGSNYVQGVIDEVVFVGAVCKYCVVVPGGSKIWGKLLSYDPTQAPDPGSSIGIGWSIADAVLLPEVVAR